MEYVCNYAMHAGWDCQLQPRIQKQSRERPTEPEGLKVRHGLFVRLYHKQFKIYFFF